MDGVAYLIAETFEEDAIGQRIPQENRREIFVTVDNIGRNEWMEAGRNGLSPELMLKTAAINYSGEEIIEFEGARYAIYRTHRKAVTDEIEFYLQRKAGV